ncbi:MAG TPA: glycosyltransferase family 39 protein [Capillimicrobium sp.]|nr:glycosyltransferase family 39 protein [Capillimicrobium sp.]
MLRLGSFEKRLGLIALVALAVRWVYAYAIRDFLVQGDAMTYHLVGQGLADGRGFVEAVPPGGPTAEHPPLLFVFWAALDKLGANGFLAHRMALGLVGVGTVIVIGLIGRRIGGDRLGLVAAGLAAVYPMLWTAEGSLMSEGLYGFILVCALLAALRLRERPTPRLAAGLGALIGLAALTRGEALALIVLLAIPVAVAARPTWRERAATWGVAVAAFVAVLAPWTIFNATRFDDPVLISTNSNGVFIGANCDDTYHGDLIGAWRFQCYTPRRPGEDEAAYFARQRDLGIEYALDHADRWPVVIAARLGRLADVYRFDQSVFFNTSEGRPARYAAWGIRAYWLVALLAIGGAVLLARRRAFALVVLLAPVVMVICVAIVTYGGTRFRYAAEPSLVVLAAVTLVAAAQRLLLRRRSAPADAVATPPSRRAPAASPPG